MSWSLEKINSSVSSDDDRGQLCEKDDVTAYLHDNMNHERADTHWHQWWEQKEEWLETFLSASYSVDHDQRRLTLEGVDSPGCVQLRPHRSQTIDGVRGGQAEWAEAGRSTGNLSPPPFPLRSCCLSSSPPVLSFSAPYCAPSSWTSPQIVTTLSAVFSHNWSGALSVVVVSVYSRFHAPPHHEPVFPHTRTCVCIFKRTHTCSGCSFNAVYTHTPSARACLKG